VPPAQSLAPIRGGDRDRKAVMAVDVQHDLDVRNTIPDIDHSIRDDFEPMHELLDHGDLSVAGRHPPYPLAPLRLSRPSLTDLSAEKPDVSIGIEPKKSEMSSPPTAACATPAGPR
jgi:hypothetical protein